MPTLTPDQLAALARAGSPNREIEAALGREMTADERVAVDRARVVARLQKARRKAEAPEDSALRVYKHRALKRDVEIKWGTIKTHRRRRCRNDLAAWLKTYKGEACKHPWSTAHRQAIERLQYAILHGGHFCLAMPRGDGKSTLCRGAAEWAVLEGHRRYVVIIGAVHEAAQNLLAAIKTTFRELPKLLEDYPELACYRVDNLAYRSRSQTANGIETGIEWTGERIRLPNVDSAQCLSRAAILEVTSITGNIRGRSVTLKDGTVLRPDFVILDDPQTKESAQSPKQTADRESIINADVLGLGGGDAAVAAVMPCTVIAPNDLAERFLDKKRNPQWAGAKTQLIESWPENMELWAEYNETRLHGSDIMDAGASANKFYREHRKALEAGAVVTWPERVPSDKVSRLQYAMEKFFDVGEAAFASEYQNEPLDEAAGIIRLTPDRVVKQQAQTPRGIAPNDAGVLTIGIDINKEGFNWVALAAMYDMTGVAIDYGKWPEGDAVLFQLGDDPNKPNFALAHTMISEGLEKFIPALFAQQYQRENGSAFPITQIGIDCAGWSGYPVFGFCERARYTADVLPCRGFGAGGRARYNEPSKQRAVAIGDGWDIRRTKGDRNMLAQKSDLWRRHVQEALQLPVSAVGSLSLYAAKPSTHRRIADHVCSRWLTAYVPELDHYEWAGVDPDHLLDALAIAVVCACARGCRIGGQRIQPEPPKAVQKRAKAEYTVVKPGEWR